jgi:hypothetical protein
VKGEAIFVRGGARKKGASGYVWVFTNSHEVVYQYSESREADILRRVMREFQEVLVSDFYAAYDSIECQQQKCLIHLLRDLNNEVLEQPYDEELKQLVHTFALVLKPGLGGSPGGMNARTGSPVTVVVT